MFTGPNITKVAGLGARGADEDNIHGLVMGGVTTAEYTAAGGIGTSVQLLSTADADALALTAAYDATNNVLVRHHIDRFFKRNPLGKLWIQLVAQTQTLAESCTLAQANGVAKLYRDSGKKCKTIGVVRNPAVGYTPTLTDGIDADVTAAVSLAQLLTDGFEAENAYIDHILVEGREINGTIASVKDMRTLNAPNVQVVIAQDKDIADLHALHAAYAAVGDCLGSIGIRRVEEDLGSIDVINNPDKSTGTFPLNDGVAFAKAAISSGTLVTSLTAGEVTALQDKGYIFADYYPDDSNLYWNKSSACTAIDDDYAFGTRMRVWNKAARLLLKRFILQYNKKVATTGGKMLPAEIEALRQDVLNTRNGLGALVRDEHAVAVDAFINPDQVLDANAANVEIEMSINVFNYIRTISGKLKLTV